MYLMILMIVSMIDQVPLIASPAAVSLVERPKVGVGRVSSTINRFLLFFADLVVQLLPSIHIFLLPCFPAFLPGPFLLAGGGVRPPWASPAR